MNWAVVGPLVDQLLALADDAEVTLCNGHGTVYVANPATNWEQRSYRADTVEEALKAALSDYGMWELI